MNPRDVKGPSDERLRAMLADTARFEYEPRRHLAPAALKRLRLRTHAISHANEFAGLFVGLLGGLATLWSADPDERDV